MRYGLIQIQFSVSSHHRSIHHQWSFVRVDPAHRLHKLTVAKHDHLLMLGTGPENAQRPLSASH